MFRSHHFGARYPAETPFGNFYGRYPPAATFVAWRDPKPELKDLVWPMADQSFGHSGIGLPDSGMGQHSASRYVLQLTPFGYVSAKIFEGSCYNQ